MFVVGGGYSQDAVTALSIVDYVGDGTNSREIATGADFDLIEIWPYDTAYARFADHLHRAFADQHGRAVVESYLAIGGAFLGPDATLFGGKMRGTTDLEKILLGSNGALPEGANDSGVKYRALCWKFQPSLWTPYKLSTLCWLDAADEGTITHIAGAVTAWTDKSGHGNDAAQATAADRPTTGTVQINGLNTIDFPTGGPSGKNMDIAALSFGDLHSIFIVTRYDAWAVGTAYNDLLRAADGSATIAVGAVGEHYCSFYGNGAAWDSVGANTPNRVVSSDCILSVIADGAGGAIPYHNAEAQDARVCSMPSKTGFTLNGNTPQKHDGPIAEMIITASALSTADRQKVEGYLAWKWGLEGELPAAHPYKNGAPYA